MYSSSPLKLLRRLLHYTAFIILHHIAFHLHHRIAIGSSPLFSAIVIHPPQPASLHRSLGPLLHNSCCLPTTKPYFFHQQIVISTAAAIFSSSRRHLPLIFVDASPLAVSIATVTALSVPTTTERQTGNSHSPLGENTVVVTRTSEIRKFSRLVLAERRPYGSGTSAGDLISPRDTLSPAASPSGSSVG
nr:hypothetical protein Iba_chr04aCG15600 [Ipomoea batatas]